MESIISVCDLIKSEILNFLFFKYKLHNIFKNIYIWNSKCLKEAVFENNEKKKKNLYPYYLFKNKFEFEFFF